jgi:hypothetical protein
VKPIASTLDHFDLVVQTLQVACADRIIAVIQQTIPLTRQGPGKLLESLDAAPLGGLDPIAQETQGFSTIPAVPQAFPRTGTVQVIFQEVDHIEVAVQFEQSFQVQALLSGQIYPAFRNDSMNDFWYPRDAFS